MRIGILGGGQLGRMIGLAGIPLGHSFRFLDPSTSAPAGEVGELLNGNYTDCAALERFGSGLDVISYEFENVPVETARKLNRQAPVFPPPQALETSQDRLFEKTLFQKLGIPTPLFFPLETEAELRRALEQTGYPAVLKTRRLGYDGKGQAVIRSEAEAAPAFKAIGGVPLILESFVPFQRELSILAVRGRSGETAVYPLVENHHRGGILRLSLAPAENVSPEIESQARNFGTAVLQALDYVGVLAIEFFECGGKLLANEMAPRVHNSGHWSIEGAVCSQFENHVRAICGLPLGSTELNGFSAMLNLIGETPSLEDLAKIPGLHVHLYGKSAAPGRKLGHLTLVDSDRARLNQRRQKLDGMPVIARLSP